MFDRLATLLFSNATAGNVQGRAMFNFSLFVLLRQTFRFFIICCLFCFQAVILVDSEGDGMPKILPRGKKQQLESQAAGAAGDHPAKNQVGICNCVVYMSLKQQSL
jgi:hypothetical protein